MAKNRQALAAELRPVMVAAAEGLDDLLDVYHQYDSAGRARVIATASSVLRTSSILLAGVDGPPDDPTRPATPAAVEIAVADLTAELADTDRRATGLQAALLAALEVVDQLSATVDCYAARAHRWAAEQVEVHRGLETPGPTLDAEPAPPRPKTAVDPKPEPVDEKLSCPDPGCAGRTFKNRRALNGHHQTVHLRSAVTTAPCDVCGRTIDRRGMKAHLAAHANSGDTPADTPSPVEVPSDDPGGDVFTSTDAATLDDRPAGPPPPPPAVVPAEKVAAVAGAIRWPDRPIERRPVDHDQVRRRAAEAL